MTYIREQFKVDRGCPRDDQGHNTRGPGPDGIARCAYCNVPMYRERDLLAEMPYMDEATRAALPPVFHRPVFDGLGVPHSWICSACWGDGWQTSWPCEAATRGGVELGRALGLEVMW